MFRALLRLLSVALLALFGESAVLWRVGACVLVGAGASVLLYWLWPTVLPAWPAIAALAVAVGAGLVWEWRARRSQERILR